MVWAFVEVWAWAKTQTCAWTLAEIQAWAKTQVLSETWVQAGTQARPPITILATSSTSHSGLVQFGFLYVESHLL